MHIQLRSQMVPKHIAKHYVMSRPELRVSRASIQGDSVQSRSATPRLGYASARFQHYANKEVTNEWSFNTKTRVRIISSASAEIWDSATPTELRFCPRTVETVVSIGSSECPAAGWVKANQSYPQPVSRPNHCSDEPGWRSTDRLCGHRAGNRWAWGRRSSSATSRKGLTLE
jgi:hypothetical protein